MVHFGDAGAVAGDLLREGEGGEGNEPSWKSNRNQLATDLFYFCLRQLEYLMTS